MLACEAPQGGRPLSGVHRDPVVDNPQVRAKKRELRVQPWAVVRDTPIGDMHIRVWGRDSQGQLLKSSTFCWLSQGS